METNVKIVGVGLNKTGTTTLGVCMRHWRFRHISNDSKAFEMYMRGDWGALMDVVWQYDSFDDWPWPLIYKEIDRTFPKSKFVLTKRSSSEVWFDSLCRHAERTGPTKYRRHVYGHAMPHGYKEEHIGRYEEHNAAVEAYFRDRPDKLLVVCWEEGDGWDELSQFLGLEAPRMLFPHANKAGSLWVRRIKKLMRSYIGRKRYAHLSRIKQNLACLQRLGPRRS